MPVPPTRCSFRNCLLPTCHRPHVSTPLRGLLSELTVWSVLHFRNLDPTQKDWHSQTAQTSFTNQSAKSGSGSLLRSSLLCTSSDHFQCSKSSAFPFTRLARNLARVFSETCWQNFNASSTLCTGPAAFAGSHAAWKAPSHCRNEMPPSRSPGPPSKTQVCLSHTEPPQRALLIQSQFLQH